MFTTSALTILFAASAIDAAPLVKRKGGSFGGARGGYIAATSTSAGGGGGGSTISSQEWKILLIVLGAIFAAIAIGYVIYKYRSARSKSKASLKRQADCEKFARLSEDSTGSGSTWSGFGYGINGMSYENFHSQPNIQSPKPAHTKFTTRY